MASRLDYCNSVLAGLPDHLIKKIQSVQNSAARLVSHVKKHDHITPVLKDLHWLPVRQRILFKVLVVTYKALHDLAPSHISDLIVPYVPTRSLCSSNKQQLVVPRYNTEFYGAPAFSIFAPAEYNKLPQHVTASPTLACFKSCLKTHLFISVFDWCVACVIINCNYLLLQYMSFFLSAVFLYSAPGVEQTEGSA